MKANSMDINGLLKTAIGQLHGIQKMVEDDRYCIDISNQLLAVQSILKKNEFDDIGGTYESMCNPRYGNARCTTKNK